MHAAGGGRAAAVGGVDCGVDVQPTISRPSATGALFLLNCIQQASEAGFTSHKRGALGLQCGGLPALRFSRSVRTCIFSSGDDGGLHVDRVMAALHAKPVAIACDAAH